MAAAGVRGLVLAVVAVLALATAGSVAAKGGSRQPRVDQDFHDLIGRGERPEIAACLAAALESVRHEHRYTAIRWDQDDADGALMWETEDHGRIARHIRLKAQARLAGSAIFSETWTTVGVRCEQAADGEVQLTLAPPSR